MSATTMIGLRKEIDDALAVVEPQIRGLGDLMKVSLSPPTVEQVNTELADHDRRRDRLSKVIAALDAVDVAMVALETDGYPAMPKAEVAAAVYAELQEQLADIQAAINEFESQPIAVSISVSLGEAVDKV